MMAEGSAMPIGGSRLALTRPRLRRLMALSRRSAWPEMPRCSRRSRRGLRPFGLIAQDGVERDEQFAHDGDERQAAWFSGVTQTLVEGAQRRILPDRDQAGHVSGARTSTRPPWMRRLPRKLPLSRFSGATPARGGDLVAIDGAEFGQLDDQRAGDHVADAGNAFEQILLGAEHRAFFDQLVDGAIDPFALGFQAAQDGLERPLRQLVGCLAQPLFLGIDHDNQLTSA